MTNVAATLSNGEIKTVSVVGVSDADITTDYIEARPDFDASIDSVTDTS